MFYPFLREGALRNLPPLKLSPNLIKGEENRYSTHFFLPFGRGRPGRSWDEGDLSFSRRSPPDRNRNYGWFFWEFFRR